MEFKALEYICAVHEAKTISQAAKNLFISQPALSQYLSKVEESLGTQIFTRRGNSLFLTSAGEILVKQGQALLKEREDMLRLVDSLSRKDTEVIRFGLSPFYSKYYLPLLLSHYREHYPNVQLDIVEMNSTDLEQQVLDGALNLCFIPADPMRDGLVYQPIYMEQIMIAVPPNHPVNDQAVPASGIPYLDVRLLKDEPFVELVSSLKFAKMSQQIQRHFGFSPKVTLRTTNWDTVCMLVAQGIGVGFLPELLIHKHRHEPVFYRIADINSTRTYAAVHLEGKSLSYAEQNLIQTLMELLKNI